MKTVYTDHFGIFPWAMMAVAIWQLVSAIMAYSAQNWTWALLYACAGAIFAFLGIRRMIDRRSAKREGGDPTIIRVRDHD